MTWVCEDCGWECSPNPAIPLGEAECDNCGGELYLVGKIETMTHEDDALAKLRETYPDWQIWYVPAAVGRSAWCARPRVNLVAGSPDELMRQLDRMEAPQQESKGFDPESDGPVRARGS